MTGRLHGKTAIVTGAGSGMGEAIARLFAREGASVALVDMTEAGERVAQEIRDAGGDAWFWTLNVTDEPRIEAVFAEVVARFGGLNILINNAGIAGPTEPTDQVALADWENVFKVNAGGTFLCTKHAIPHLRAMPGQTSIVNMSSMYAIVGNADVPVYHATKAAVLAMTKTDAITYAAEGIRVNAILPGTIMTPMNLEKARQTPGYIEQMKSIHPLGEVGEPDDVAYAMLFLASDESKFTTGAQLVIDGGYTAQ